MPAKESRLEKKFAFLWRCLDGPPLEREFKFHPKRKWRSDFAQYSDHPSVRPRLRCPDSIPLGSQPLGVGSGRTGIHVKTPAEAFCMLATALDVQSDAHIVPVRWND